MTVLHSSLLKAESDNKWKKHLGILHTIIGSCCMHSSTHANMQCTFELMSTCPLYIRHVYTMKHTLGVAVWKGLPVGQMEIYQCNCSSLASINSPCGAKMFVKMFANIIKKNVFEKQLVNNNWNAHLERWGLQQIDTVIWFIIENINQCKWIKCSNHSTLYECSSPSFALI